MLLQLTTHNPRVVFDLLLYDNIGNLCCGCAGGNTMDLSQSIHCVGCRHTLDRCDDAIELMAQSSSPNSLSGLQPSRGPFQKCVTTYCSSLRCRVRRTPWHPPNICWSHIHVFTPKTKSVVFRAHASASVLSNQMPSTEISS